LAIFQLFSLKLAIDVSFSRRLQGGSMLKLQVKERRYYSVNELYDAIIIGSGGAGLSCALELHETKVRYLVLEQSPRLAAGLNQIAGKLPNFLGGFFESGEQLRQRVVELADRVGLNFLVDCPVSQVDLPELAIVANGKQFWAKSLVLATGYRKRRLLPEQEPMPGVRYDKDNGVETFAGRNVVVVGAGDNGLMDAIELSEHCPVVYVVHRNRSFKARPDLISQAESKPNIKFLLDAKVTALHGEDGLEAIIVRDQINGTERQIETRDVIVRIGYEPNTELFRGQIEMDDTGHVFIAPDCSTSVAGVFAAGDITNPGYPRLATAVGHGMIAAGAVRSYLKNRADNISGSVQRHIAGAELNQPKSI
jgi:thioredoxin reductase (NADPH)